MEREPGYLAVKVLIEAGYFKHFADIFPVHSRKTNLARYLGTNNARMDRLIRRPWLLTIAEVESIAAFYDVTFDALLPLVRK